MGRWRYGRAGVDSGMDLPPPDPLTPDEIDFIEALLARGPGDVTSFEMLDGFFAALITGPELMVPSRYLPVVFGDGTQEGDIVWESQEQFQQAFQLLMRHWNLMVVTLLQMAPWPLVIGGAREDGLGYDWAQGFLLGMDLGSGWKRVANDGLHSGLFVAVGTLAREPGQPGAEWPMPVGRHSRKVLLAAIALGLPLLYLTTRPPSDDHPPRRRSKSVKPRKKPRRR